MVRRMIIIVLCLVLLISLTSCYDAHEIDEWAYVYNIGVDKGVSEKLRFTFQLPAMKSDSVGDGGVGKRDGQEGSKTQQHNSTVLTIDAPTFYSGADLVNTSLSRTLNYMHAKYIIIGEDLAREGIGQILNGMSRSRQIRRIMYIIVVKGKASDFINGFNPVLGVAVSKTQEGLIKQQERTGLFGSKDYNEFLNDMKSLTRQPTAILAALNDFSHLKEGGKPSKEYKKDGDYSPGELPRTGGNHYEFFGTALFEADKMVGELNATETRVMLMVRGDFDRGSLVIPDPKDKDLRISLDTKQKKKPNIKVSLDNGSPIIDVKIFLEGDIQNVQSDTEYESEELKPVLEEEFRKTVKGVIDDTIKKCIELNCDVFGFGEKAVMQFSTIQEWEEYNWISHFKDAQVKTEVELTIRRTGTMIKTNPIW